MTFNLPYSPDFHGGQSNNPAPQNSSTLKARAVRVLRAFIHAPGGCGVEAVYRCLTSLEPVPSYREAVQLTEKLPAQVGSRSLARYFAFLQAVERIEAQRVVAQTAASQRPARPSITPDRAHGPDWVNVTLDANPQGGRPTQEGGVA